MNKYSQWLKTASILQFLAAFFQAGPLFTNEQPKNDTEKQLFYLMDTYRFDFGGHSPQYEQPGFSPGCFLFLAVSIGRSVELVFTQEKS